MTPVLGETKKSEEIGFKTLVIWESELDDLVGLKNKLSTFNEVS